MQKSQETLYLINGKGAKKVIRISLARLKIIEQNSAITQYPSWKKSIFMRIHSRKTPTNPKNSKPSQFQHRLKLRSGLRTQHYSRQLKL